MAAFDQATDRFYMQSQSESLPGVWVFDGRLSAWVGFIGALDLTIAYAGNNQLNGRYYIGGSSYMIPVEGRHTPVPQGRVVPIPAIQSQLYWTIRRDGSSWPPNIRKRRRSSGWSIRIRLRLRLLRARSSTTN